MQNTLNLWLKYSLTFETCASGAQWIQIGLRILWPVISVTHVPCRGTSFGSLGGNRSGKGRREEEAAAKETT